MTMFQEHNDITDMEKRTLTLILLTTVLVMAMLPSNAEARRRHRFDRFCCARRRCAMRGMECSTFGPHCRCTPRRPVYMAMPPPRFLAHPREIPEKRIRVTPVAQA